MRTPLVAVRRLDGPRQASADNMSARGASDEAAQRLLTDRDVHISVQGGGDREPEAGVEGHAANSQPNGTVFAQKYTATDSAEHLIGLALYTGSTVTNSGMSLFAKLLGLHGFPVFEIVLVRSIFILGCAVVPVVLFRISPLGNKRGFLVLRGICSFLSVSSLYWSVNLLPLSDALVLQFLSPPMVAASSPALLGEFPPRVVYVAIPVCLVAVILIARPEAIFGNSPDQKPANALGVGLGIFQAVAASANKLVTRYLKGENTHVNLLYLGAVSTIGALFMCLVLSHSFQKPGSGLVSGLLLANALCGYLTQMMITTGLKRIPATLGTATSYLTVVWGMVLGYFVFHEVPTLMSLLGAAMICGSALALSIVEGRPAPSQPSDGGAYASQGSGLQRMKQGLLGLCRRAASWGKREQGWMSLRQDEQMQETEMMLAPGR